jgi:lantibiotic modifying enzyme
MQCSILHHHLLPLLLCTLLLAAAVKPGVADSATDPQPESGNYLDYALKTERWLRQQAVDTPQGRIWRSADETNDHPVTNGNLYYGSAGIILFYLELFQQTGDDAFLAQASLGAQYLRETIPDELYIKKDLNFLEIFPSLNLPEGNGMASYTVANGRGHPNQASLYWGVSGIGFALGEMYRVTGDTAYRQSAWKVVDLLRQYHHRDESGVTWGSVPELMLGDAGVGLFLLYAADELKHHDALQLSREVGNSLLARGEPDHGGLMWPTGRVYFNTDHPNFSHGTSGIGYFLAALYQQTGDPRYLAGARQVGDYLVNIAHDNGLIAHHLPDDGLVYYGWCHGPVGTNRLFEKLSSEHPEQQWNNIVKRSDQATMDADLFSRKQQGFWQNVGQCCGSAGIADYFLRQYLKSDDPRQLAFARQATADIIEHATVEDNTLSWTHAEHRSSPDFRLTLTGYMQGAAGIGMHFLRMHAYINEQPVSIHLLDDRW